jgi:SAM-dependent methyltransferase
MLDEHWGYITDVTRQQRLEQAILRVVKPEDVVADVGCGAGILGLLCLRAGAGFVHGIDSTAILEVARETFLRAGWSQRIQLHRAKSQQVSLPERVDVLICDHVGYFGFDYGIVEFFTDARRRFLKPGGQMIPSKINLQLAPVESPACVALVDKWAQENVPPEYRWVRQYGVSTKHAVHLKKDEILGEPVDLGSIDFRDDHPDFFSWQAELVVRRDGQFHGLGGWFDCELTQGVWMTNSPIAEHPIDRSQVFLPISEPVSVFRGEKIRAKIMARPTDSVIMWEVEFVASGRKFSHSTWQGMLLSADELVQQSPMHIPMLSDKGRARLLVLGYCDGLRTAKQIESAVLRDHPNLFPSAAETTRFVAQVLAGDTH